MSFIDTSDMNLMSNQVIYHRGEVVQLEDDEGILRNYKAKVDITAQMVIELTGLKDDDPRIKAVVE